MIVPDHAFRVRCTGNTVSLPMNIPSVYHAFKYRHHGNVGKNHHVRGTTLFLLRD